MSLQAVIFDLDGVVRHYDRVHERSIESRFGLEAGSLLRIGFGGDLGRSFMCGEIDHGQFARSLGELLESPGAAAEFVAMRAEVDPAAVALVRSLQARLPVALLTNGSLRTRHELAEAGLGDAFDHVFNSAETGAPKPHPQAYLNVLEVLGTPPQLTGFIDDHLPNVEGAEAVGIVGHHYRGLGDLMKFLGGHGLLDRDAAAPGSVE